MIVILVLASLLRIAVGRKYYRTNKRLQREFTYIFSEEKIMIVNDENSSRVDWDDLYAAKESKKIIALYISTLQAYILPKRFFTEEEEKEVKGFIRKKMEPKKFRLKQQS
jgi:hypothetical protein